MAAALLSGFISGLQCVRVYLGICVSDITKCFVYVGVLTPNDLLCFSNGAFNIFSPLENRDKNTLTVAMNIAGMEYPST